MLTICVSYDLMDLIVIFYCKRWSACWPVWFIMKVQVLPIYTCLSQNSKLEAVLCMYFWSSRFYYINYMERTYPIRTHYPKQNNSMPSGCSLPLRSVLKHYLILDAIAYMTSIVLIIIDQVDKNDVQTEQNK